MPRDSSRELLKHCIQVSIKLTTSHEKLIFAAHHDKFLMDYFFYPYRWWGSQSGRPFLLPPVQLLTGDTDLKPNEFERHFDQELSAIGLTLLPHHGSKHNWHKKFLSAMRNCQIYAVSFGLGNNNKHPHPTVVNDICTAQKQIMLCNEVQGNSIHFDIWLRP